MYLCMYIMSNWARREITFNKITSKQKQKYLNNNNKVKSMLGHFKLVKTKLKSQQRKEISWDKIKDI